MAGACCQFGPGVGGLGVGAVGARGSRGGQGGGHTGPPGGLAVASQAHPVLYRSRRCNGQAIRSCIQSWDAVACRSTTTDRPILLQSSREMAVCSMAVSVVGLIVIADSTAVLALTTLALVCHQHKQVPTLAQHSVSSFSARCFLTPVGYPGGVRSTL